MAKTSGFMAEFKQFIARGNVMDMAVGVIIGGAFGKISTSLVNDVIMPAISMVTGGLDFTAWKVILKPEVLDAAGAVVTPAVSINYGNLISTILDFIIIAVMTSSMLSGRNSKMRHRLTMAGVMDTSGFSVVEPIKRTMPFSIAGRMESDCDLLQRWHSSSRRYVA